MKDLIERLEGLTGPCRECDRDLALAKGWTQIRQDWFCPPNLNVHHHLSELPRYTASIDAAMTLVPEGCMWNVGGDPKGGFASAGLFGAAIWQGIDQIHGEAPAPAIALCIAALKATP